LLWKTLSTTPRTYDRWKAEDLSFLHELLVWGVKLSHLLNKMCQSWGYVLKQTEDKIWGLADKEIKQQEILFVSPNSLFGHCIRSRLVKKSHLVWIRTIIHIKIVWIGTITTPCTYYNLYNNCMNSFVWICTKISEKIVLLLCVPVTEWVTSKMTHRTKSATHMNLYKSVGKNSEKK
jgi:hypothetical protein